MRLLVLLTLVASACCAASSDNSALEPASDTNDPAPTTHALLSKLGMRRLRLPAAHHRKRLAEQARRRATGDSRMYVIKLPPNQHYYAHEAPGSTEARTLPLSLHSNGKPARVYHWNLPMLHKLATENGRHQARLDDDVVDVESKSTWGKPSRPHPNSIDAPAYYVPVKPKKSSFRKYFSGNGKPKSFYVIDKDKKAAEYHRLLP